MVSAQSLISFIRDNKTWFIDPARPKTRSACAEVLGRLPRNVQAAIVDERRLLLIAPPAGISGQVRHFPLDANPEAPRQNLAIVVLSPDLEMLMMRPLVGFVAKCVAAAVAASVDSSLQGVRPEGIAIRWGFGGELSDRKRAPRFPCKVH